MSDPSGESKERNREIAENESARQTTGNIRVSVGQSRSPSSSPWRPSAGCMLHNHLDCA